MHEELFNFGQEAPRPLAEMSRQEQALDWLDKAGSSRDIERRIITAETEHATGGALSHHVSQQPPHMSPDERRADTQRFEREVVWPQLDADPNVIAKNRLIAGMYAEVNDGAGDNPVLDMLSNMRQDAGDADPRYPEMVDDVIARQFRALWIIKSEL